MFGLAIGMSAVADGYWRSLPKPESADPSPLARGQQLYQTSCASCYGLSGHGESPAGFGPQLRPADFRVHVAARHTDPQLFDWVSNGDPGTAMPPFGAKLSEQDRWDVINYLRLRHQMRTRRVIRLPSEAVMLHC